MTEELFKAYWHVGLGLIFGVSAAHNIMRWTVTKKPINAFNAGLYAGITIWEIKLIGEHFKKHYQESRQ